MSPRLALSARFAVLFSITIFAACGGGECLSGPLCPGSDPVLTPTTIQTSVTTLSFDRLGASQAVSATVRDQNGNAMSGQSVTWASTDQNVATVNSSGTVTAVGNGTTLVSATSGSLSANVNVTVLQVPMTVTISPDPILLDGLGTSVTLTALVTDGGGFTIDGPTLAWSSADESTVSVSSAGVATAVGEGTTSINVQASYAGSATIGNQADAVVTVPLPPLIMNPAQPPIAEPGVPFNFTFSASGGDGSYTWSITNGSLPAGLTLNSSTGAVSGTPSVVGTATFTLRVEDGTSATAERQFTIEVYAPYVLLATEFCGDYDAADIATFEDANLDAAVRAALGIGALDDLTCGLVTSVTDLIAQSAGITSAAGVQNLTGAVEIDVRDNSITDLTWFGGLTNLTRLVLRGNAVPDLSAISGLINLTGLGIGVTGVSDLTPLSGMTGLLDLFAGRNAITDLAPLSQLTSLRLLYLNGNGLTDISVLSGFTSLETLRLEDNAIIDVTALQGLTNLQTLRLDDNLTLDNIQPLIANTGLGVGDDVNIAGTAVSCVDVVALEAKGVALTHSCTPAVLLATELCSDYSALDIATFADANLEAVIMGALGVPSAADLSCGLVTGLPGELNASSAGIASLVGAQNLTGLDGFLLGDNTITDIAPVSGLTGLTTLWLHDNPGIGDISLLAGLSNLVNLHLARVSTSNVAPLGGLTALASLDLDGNTVSDISPLSGLTALTDLSLGGNGGFPLTPLSGLTGLVRLVLAGNNVTDISALSGLSALTELQLFNNFITDVTALQGLTNLQILGMQNNASLSDIDPLLANTGLGAGDDVDLLDTAISCADALALEAKGVTLTHNCTPAVLLSTEFCSDYSALDIASFADANLETAVRDELGIGALDDLTCGLVTSMTQLTPQGVGIVDVTGIQNLTGATWIDVRNNSITDLTWFSGLTNLNRLTVRGNPSPVLTPLSGLTNLTALDVTQTGATNLAPLSALTGITEIYIQNNGITDISGLSGMTGMSDLYAGGNSIADLTPVSGYANPRLLYFGNNAITDVSPLAGLTNLEVLNLAGNAVSDIGPLTGFTNLLYLYASFNTITDVTAVTGMTRLTQLTLNDNPGLTNIQPLLDNTGLGFPDEVNLTNTLVSCGDVVALEAKGVTVTHNCTPLVLAATDLCSNFSYLDIATFADANLDAAVRAEVGIGALDDLTCGLVTGVASLTANGVGITSLVGAQNLTGAVTFRPYSNSITDLSPISGLTNLEWLDVHSNPLATLAPLSGLTNLRTLDLFDTETTDVSPLSTLTSLQTLFVHTNSVTNWVTDFSPLASLPLLTSLDARGNKLPLLADVATLSGLTNLTFLLLSNSDISNISPLSVLTNLEYLQLSYNSIIDVSALQGLTNLETLGLVDNALLTNIQPLIDNTGLGTGDSVDLTGTFVSCLSVDALRANGVTVTLPGC